MRRPLAIVVSLSLALTAAVVPATTAGAASTETVVESFDSPSLWTRALGTASVAAASSSTEGAGALAYTYTVGPNSEIGYASSPAALAEVPYSSLKIDYKGNGSYNTLYLKIIDASGEVFAYRVGNLNQTAWVTGTVNLTKPPALASGGNLNGVLDGPLKTYRLAVARNGSEPPTGTFSVDNLRAVTDGWSKVTSPDSFFTPSPGASTSLDFTAGEAGDYEVRAVDAAGTTKTFTGTATAPGPVSLPWDGLGDGADYLVGSVSTVIRYDASPGDGLAAQPVTSGGLGTLSLGEVTDGAVVENFDDSANWVNSVGTVSAAAAATHTEGTGAVTLSYTVGPNAEVRPLSAPDFSSVPYSALKLDYKGDGTYNTLYVKLIDVTGEVFVYRVGGLNNTSWATTTVDLTEAPSLVSGGNADSVLDAPLKVYRLAIARNGSEPPSGTVSLDNLRTVTDGWSQVDSPDDFFTPGPDLSTSLEFTAGTPGDYRVVARDESGRTKAFEGVAASAGLVSLPWDGSSDNGDTLEGVVSAALSYDLTPGDGLDAQSVTSGQPHVLSISESSDGTTQVESFDDGGASWQTALGSATISPAPSHSEGSGALLIDYNLAGSTVEIGRTTTPQELPGLAYTGLKLNYRGDGSQNTLNIRLRDASGESFMYRIGNLNSTTWKTATIDLSATPALVSGGNGNGILDAPIRLYRAAVAYNSGQPTVGTVALDNLRLIDTGWTAPTAAPSSLNKTTGGSAALGFNAGAPGDYRLVLADPAGRTRTLTGTASTAGAVTISWNGLGDDSSYLSGNVGAVLSYDSTPDGTLDAQPATIGSPYLSAVSKVAARTSPGSIVGVNGALTTYDDIAKADSDAALMESAYVGWDREEFSWSMLEPRDDYFEFYKTDQALAVASARNVNLIGKLFYTAPWASSAPAGTSDSDARYYPPADMADYVDYVETVVERYKDSIDVWEIWNEPDIVQYWKPAPSAAQYAELLKTAYATIKRVDPDAKVLTAGFAGFSDSYMQGLVNAGAGQSFDGLAIHTYVAGMPESGTIETWINGAQAWIARNKPGAELWITEVGWSTCSGCTNPVTEAQQADYLARMYLDAAARGVRGVAWFSLREYGNSTSNLDNYGLVTTAGVKKPAYTALRQVGAALYQTASGGRLAPTDGTSTLLSDMSSTSGLTLSKIGSATGSMSTSTSRHGGAGSIALSYNFPNTGSGFALNMSVPVAGEPKALSVWAYGDSSNQPVYLKFADANGETFEAKVGNLALKKWQRFTYYFDGGNPGVSTSGGDGIIDYPITVKNIHVFRSTSGVNSGQVLLDDLTAHYGVITRGTMLMGRSFNTQAVYGISSATAALPVARSAAYLLDFETITTLSVTSGKAAVDIRSRPKYVVTTLGISPSPVAQGSPVSVTWQGGDREKYTVQVTTGAGATVRTLATAASYDSGTRTITWDGITSNGTVAAKGPYRFRVELVGTDGRVAVLTQSFTIN